MSEIRFIETKEAFEQRYARKFPKAKFGITHLAMPCICEDGGGPTHWAAIRNTPECVQDHLDHQSALKELTK